MSLWNAYELGGWSIRGRRVVAWTAAVALALPLFATAGGTASGVASSEPQFGHEVVVDHQRVAGEPSLSISSVLNSRRQHDIYVSTPYGFSTTASFVWKAEDGGQSFHLIGDAQASGAAPTGKPAGTCIGGGDSSIVNDSAGNLYFADLQGLTNVSASVSTNGGKTFTSTCDAAQATVVDRPWLSVDGNPLTTGREYMTVDDVSQCDPDKCGLGQTGANVLELTQASGLAARTQTFAPLPGQQIEPDGIVSGTVVNQSNGDLYIVHTGLTDNSGKLIGGADANGNTNAIIVDYFPGGFKSSTIIPFSGTSLCKPYNTSPLAPCYSYTAYHAPVVGSGNATTSTVTTGQDFTPMAIDRAGDIYVTWSQAPVNQATGVVDGPSTIYMAASTNHGAAWSPAINVSQHVSGLRTNLFPWIAAGSRGRLDIVWYGTSALGSCPNRPCAGVWNVYMAQTLNAVSSSGRPNSTPSFSTTKVSEYPNHYGDICTMGIGCSTGGGDRGLVDFLQVQVEPSGAADVVWADSANTNFQAGESSAIVAFAHQVAGPGLFAGSVTGPAPAFGSAPGSPASYFAGNTFESQAPARSNVDIVTSSFSATPGRDFDGDNDQYYQVTMRVGSLAQLVPPSMAGDTDRNLIWLTRWEVPNPHPTQTDQGHIFYAAMESDGGGKPYFFDGQSVCGIPPNNPEEHCKFITYPPQHILTTGSYTTSGTITILVPVKDVGGSTDPTLYSVTAVTATQALSSTSGTGIFNVIDSTPPYDAVLR